MCGDSTSIDAVEKLMDGRKADMVFHRPALWGRSWQSTKAKPKVETREMIENMMKISTRMRITVEADSEWPGFMFYS